jgi:hypothetical protein
VTNSVPDPPPSFIVAEEQFREFLGSQNYPKALFWVFPGDVVIDRERCCWITPHRGAAREQAAQSYEKGLQAGHGICLRAICASETETFTMVFIPADELDSQYHLMGQCLKLSCPTEKLAASTCKNPLKWLVLTLVNGKRSTGLWT